MTTEKEFLVNFKVAGKLYSSYQTIKANNKEEAEKLAHEFFEETTGTFADYYEITQQEITVEEK